MVGKKKIKRISLHDTDPLHETHMSVSINTLFLEHSHAYLSHSVYDSFQAATAELSHFRKALRKQKMFTRLLVFYRKYLPYTPGYIKVIPLLIILALYLTLSLYRIPYIIKYPKIYLCHAGVCFSLL